MTRPPNHPDSPESPDSAGRPAPPAVGVRRAGTGVRNIVGGRLRQARQDRTPPLTQADLAALVGAYGVSLSQDAVSRIESGARPVYDFEVRALCEALVVSAGWLLNVEDL